MAGGPMTTGAFTHLYEKDFNKIFFDEYKRMPKEYLGVAKVSTEKKSGWVKKGDMYGLGAFQQVHENQALPLDAFQQGNQKIMYFNEFRLGVGHSRIAREDDQYGAMSRGMTELGKSAGYTLDLKFWDVLNSGHLAVRRGLDGQPLFSEVHPLGGVPGAVVSNIVNASLSKTAIQAAWDLIDGMVNEKGIPIVMKPMKLLVPYQLKWKAEELCESEKDPENANNTINSMKSITGLKYQVCHYLTDPNACYLVCDDHDLEFVWRRNVGFGSYDDFNTQATIYQGDMRFQCTFFEWRGVVKITGV
jgi:phage major head subunit gpT-like protein